MKPSLPFHQACTTIIITQRNKKGKRKGKERKGRRKTELYSNELKKRSNAK
jgi:hypothetical protein